MPGVIIPIHQELRSQFGSDTISALIKDSVCKTSNRSLTRNPLTLHEACQYFATGLQQRMPHHNLQKPLEPLPPVLDNIITKPICKHLPWQRGYGDPRALPFKYISEIFKVGVAATYGAMLQFEGWYAGPTNYLVVCVHAPRCAVSLRAFNLCQNQRISVGCGQNNRR